MTAFTADGEDSDCDDELQKHTMENALVVRVKCVSCKSCLACEEWILRQMITHLTVATGCFCV